MRGATIGKEPLRVFIVFQPTRPLRGATTATNPSQIYRYHFNPRAPCGARRTTVPKVPKPKKISTHAPLAGRDKNVSPNQSIIAVFQPTRPLRGATKEAVVSKAEAEYFNPRAPCGARRNERINKRIYLRISTHAPLAGRDNSNRIKSTGLSGFQPTRPLRGATSRQAAYLQEIDFNPRAPCGARLSMPTETNYLITISTHAPLAGRDRRRGSSNPYENISTHAPLAGRDLHRKRHIRVGGEFQPTRPLRGATVVLGGGVNLALGFQPTRPLRGATRNVVLSNAGECISTHAPLAGRDRFITGSKKRRNISTHAPLAGRDEHDRRIYMPEVVFQPTRPLRGATRLPPLGHPTASISTHAPLAGRDLDDITQKTKKQISTHAPLAGRDTVGLNFASWEQDFNPRAPCGARRAGALTDIATTFYFNPRAPCGARRSNLPKCSAIPSNFNPRAPCGARLSPCAVLPRTEYFNPRAPCGARLIA